MNFWLRFILFVLLFLGIKVYVIRGIYQVFRSTRVRNTYAAISISSLLIGIPTLMYLFRSGLIDLSFWQNFLIALMLSIIICELLITPFFLIDDIMYLFQSFWRHIKPISNTSPNNTVSPKERRRFLKMLGVGAVSLPFLSFLKGITWGKYSYQVIEKELFFEDLPPEFDGFRIAQFSDFHAGSFDSIAGVKKGIDLLQEQDADMIVFTGDLVNHLQQEIRPYKKLLTNLSAPFGKFSILGNHDYPLNKRLFPSKAAGDANFVDIQTHHYEMGFELLMNESKTIEKNGQKIRLIGVENWGNGFLKKGDLDLAIENCEEDEFSILLSHDPTHWERIVIDHSKHIHLTLSGHTHGMQMGIEMLGIKWSPAQFRYQRWGGLYTEKNQHLYINRGFGFLVFAGRVGIPPEITVLTLRKK